MTNNELKEALISQKPVVLHSLRHGMTLHYRCVQAIRYVPGKDGKIAVQAELLDYNNGSVTIASAEDISLDEERGVENGNA